MNKVKYRFKRLVLGLKKALGYIDALDFRRQKIKLKGKYLHKLSYHPSDTLKEDGIGIAVDLAAFNSLAEVGRNLIDMLKKTDIPFEVFDTEREKIKADVDLAIPYRNMCSDSLHYKKKILCTVNECYKEPEYENYITPFWEFESGIKFARPALFDDCAGLITFSDFCYHYFKKIAPKGMCVYKIRYPFIKHWEIKNSPQTIRGKLGLHPSDYIVFYHFDYNSCYERKNPEAVLNAFAKAFVDKQDVQLVIKTNGFEQNQDKVKRLTALARTLKIKDRTHFVHQHLSKNDLMELINSADVYISLHRGEGFGLGMLEAMALSKPVIATNYGGNTEFMNKDNSLLVDYGWMRPKNLDYRTYQKVEKWADPDIDQAAKYLKDLYENRKKGKELGQKAQAFVENYFNVKNFEHDINKFLNRGGQMKHPIISVIVPVYKVEKYLDECIQSILKQTFQDFELILVNDGSPDKSGEICQKYAQKDNRIVYIYQENKGVAAARNRGIEAARGEWIWIMDSDDTIDDTYLQNAYSLVNENVDLVIDVKNLPEDTKVEELSAIETYRPFYRKRILDQFPDIRFPVGIQPCEDGLFNHLLLAITPNAVLNRTAGIYHYRQHPQGNHFTINKNPGKVLNQIPQWFVILKAFYDKHNLWNKKRLHLARFMEFEPWRNRFMTMPFSLHEREQLYHLIKDFMDQYVLPGLSKEEYDSLGTYFKRFLEAKDFKQALKTLRPKHYKLWLFLIKFVPVPEWRRSLRKQIKRK